MPAKPSWYSKAPYIIQELRKRPAPYVDSGTIQLLLGISRRRAQQILEPCVVDRVGTSGLADRNTLIAHLERLVEGDDGVYEIQRRRKVAEVIDHLRQERLANPHLLVAAPTAVLNQEFGNLPIGVELAPGRIVVEFGNPQEGLEKLLALAMAISRDFDEFERCVRSPE